MGIVQSLFGGAKPSLKPQGPAPFTQPPERDRQALFWWLKRNTSYTAIAHNAKLWSTFAAEFEQWLRSQQEPPQEDITTYKHIVDGQLCYERGLQQLKQGDRSVWRQGSSEGWLAKVNTGLIARRMDLYGPPDEYFEQYGLPLTMIRSYKAAHEAAMAIPWDAWYDGMGRPDNSARHLLMSLPFDTSLPEPHWEISFAPGKTSPKDGIYEQVDQTGHIVGGMAYFIKGMKSAPECWLEFGPNATNKDTNEYLWRLLWEDTRYKDGSIPEEERLYPTPSDSLHPVLAPPPQRLRCEAPNPCPREGWWHTPAQPGSRRFFKTGELMPDLRTDYGATIWEWDAQ